MLPEASGYPSETFETELISEIEKILKCCLCSKQYEIQIMSLKTKLVTISPLNKKQTKTLSK